MADFTDVFHALDYNNKGYILIFDFKKEMQKYLDNDSGDVNSGKALNKLMELIKVSENGKVYFEDFKEAIHKLEQFLKDHNSCEEIIDSSNYIQACGTSPFIDDGDNYSVSKTTDSGFDQANDGQSVGKMNRKLIKKFQQSDLIPGKDSPGYQLSQNDLSNDTKSNYFRGNFDLPLDDLCSSYNGKGLHRRQSDFAICSNRKVTQRSRDEDVHSLNCWTPCSGSAADLFYHESMTDIQKKLETLEKSMENLHNVSVESKQSKRKHGEESNSLIRQVYSLEEKIRDLKKQFEKDLYQERETARRNLSRLEKAKYEEIEYLKWSIKVKEEELEKVRKEFQVTTTDNERLRYDKVRSEDKLLDLLQQMTCIEGEMKRLKDYHSRELEVLMSEKNTVLMKAAKYDGKKNANKECNDMSQLKSENSRLKRKLEECESELLAISVQQGHNVLLCTKPDNSWMAEIDGYTKDEVIDLLVKEKDGNFRLREYVSRILTRIIDKDPSLLEISQI